jgi:sugar lactone lactonase YvrE
MLRTFPTRPFLSGLKFGEGPRWHDGRLWVSDIEGGAVLTVDAGGTATVAARLARPSGLGFLPGGDAVVVGMRTGKLFRLHDGTLTEFVDLSAHGESFNDLVTLPDGSCYVNCYRPGPPVAPVTGPDGHPRAIAADINRYYINGLGVSPSIDGAIALISPAGQVRPVASGINYPNGMVVTPDLRTLIVSVSYESQLVAFDIQPDGGLANRRLWADLPGRHPDGICLDAEGAVWVSSVATCAWIRVIAGGQITHQIPAPPDRWATAVALGGADGRTLFLVSGYPMGSPQGRSWIDTAEAEIPHAGWP